MKCFVGLGSNLGDRLVNLESASHRLPGLLRGSPVIQNPAMVPADAPSEWNKSFLNAVAEIDFEGSPTELFLLLKKIEKEFGRTEGPRWSPRVIDLDILTFGEETLQTSELRIPHADVTRRNFVLDPLKHLSPSFQIPGSLHSVLSLSRQQKTIPIWMGIFNLTPDSFSDGGTYPNESSLFQALAAQIQAGVQILDLGAESTRPNATPVTPNEEWQRLQSGLFYLKTKLQGKTFRPLISVDTRNVEVAEKCLEAGADIINDVSALADSRMIDLLKEHTCQYVLMHSLSVPASGSHTLPKDVDPVEHIKTWAKRRIAELTSNGISMDRIIFDPGIGFGKTARQSLEILRRVQEFSDLPVRVMIGHSRKSFMSLWNDRRASERDPESVGVSMVIAQKNVDIIRVHQPAFHQRAYLAMEEMQ